MGIIADIERIVRRVVAQLPEHLGTQALRIACIIIAATLVNRFAHHAIDRIVRRAVRPDGLNVEAERKREDTLIRIIAGALHIVVWIIGLLLILTESGMNIAPLLAAAGAIGVAVGLGAQTLIKDLIAGIFITIENQYRVGDIVRLNIVPIGITGTVEDMSLRTTVLRDLDGALHHVQHGAIVTVANLSHDYARVNLNVGVSYAADIEHVITVVNRVGQELANDPTWREKITVPPRFERVDAFEPSAVVVKILGDTGPLEHVAVTGELRKRLLVAFRAEHIEIPFPQQVMHIVEAKK